MALSSTALFEVSNLTARYGLLTAVENVSLRLEPGSCVGIFGHNGSGKSTLLKCLIGSIEDVSGEVRFEGNIIEPGAIHRNVQRGIGFMPQSRNVFPSLTVEQCLRIAGTRSGLDSLDSVFEIFPLLGERLEQPAGSMSGGQQQMLAVGMVLMRQPKAILLDEPTAGLSPVAAKIVFESLVMIHKKLGTLVILVEQNVINALDIVKRVIVLKAGTVAIDTDAQAFQNKQDLWKWF